MTNISSTKTKTTFRDIGAGLMAARFLIRILDRLSIVDSKRLYAKWTFNGKNIGGYVNQHCKKVSTYEYEVRLSHE